MLFGRVFFPMTKTNNFKNNLYNRRSLTIWIGHVLFGLLVVFGFLNPASKQDLIFGFILAGYVMLAPLWQRFWGQKRSVFKYVYVAPVILIFIATSYLNSGSIRNYVTHEPQPETYRTDMDDFLRTYYLMEKGDNYYVSFNTAVRENAFKSQASYNLWSWRLPTVFYMWKFIPGNDALGIYLLFLLLCVIALFSAYALCLKIIGQDKMPLSLLSAYLLFPYLHFAARDQTFLQTEWWGMIPMLVGLNFFFGRRNMLSICMFTLALLTREIFVVPMVLLFLIALVYRRQSAWIFLYPIIFLIIAIGLHAFNILKYIPYTEVFLRGRFHGLDKTILLATLAFGSWEYYFNGLRIFIIFYILGIIGIFLNKKIATVLMLAMFLLPLSFLLIGSSAYNDYWGILYMPFVIITVPLVLRPFL